MDCCKRHGTIPIGDTQAGSLEECMKICGFTLACQSVDFQKDTGMCYFGKHSGAPTIAASGWASAYAIGCAGACKKEGRCVAQELEVEIEIVFFPNVYHEFVVTAGCRD